MLLLLDPSPFRHQPLAARSAPDPLCAVRVEHLPDASALKSPAVIQCRHPVRKLRRDIAVLSGPTTGATHCFHGPAPTGTSALLRRRGQGPPVRISLPYAQNRVPRVAVLP